MSKVAIEIQGLGKKYRIGGLQVADKTFGEFISNSLLKPVRAAASIVRRDSKVSSYETIWALKNISLEIPRGEVIGLIGRNGAGKSTLLKILSRITQPTTGYVKVCGRTGALLEVGTGFHAELTGRENVYLNGAILGMRRAEIDRKFEEIVEFSEISYFIDTPVKHYSSGMYLRLAFAVAAHLEPENLFVDEVLAVGDAAFQKKCLGKMSDVASEGRTIAFVSHNMAAIQNLCTRVVWLDQGQIREDGPTAHVVSNYLRTTISMLKEQHWDSPAEAPGNDRVRLRRVQVRPETTALFDAIHVSTPFTLEFDYWNLVPDAHLNLSLIIYNEQGTAVFNTVPINEPVWHGRPFPVGLFRSICHVPGQLLNAGTYRIQLLVVQNQGTIIYRNNDILSFDVTDINEERGNWYGQWIGTVRPNLEWSTELLDQEPAPLLESKG